MSLWVDQRAAASQRALDKLAEAAADLLASGLDAAGVWLAIYTLITRKLGTDKRQQLAAGMLTTAAIRLAQSTEDIGDAPAG